MFDSNFFRNFERENKRCCTWYRAKRVIFDGRREIKEKFWIGRRSRRESISRVATSVYSTDSSTTSSTFYFRFLLNPIPIVGGNNALSLSRVLSKFIRPLSLLTTSSSIISCYCSRYRRVLCLELRGYLTTWFHIILFVEVFREETFTNFFR